MNRHLMITEPMMGNGDIECLENMILTAQHEDRKKAFDGCLVDVILIFSRLKLPHATLRLENALEKLKAYPDVRVHSILEEPKGKTNVESGWALIGEVLANMQERVQGRRPEKIKFDTLTIIPNAHRLIPMGADGVIMTHFFSAMMEAIYIYVDTDFLKKNMILYTEIGRIENNKKFALQTKGLESVPESFIHISSFNELVPGAHERYQYIIADDVPPLQFDIQVPHFCFRNMEEISIQFPVMSPEKINDLKAYKMNQLDQDDAKVFEIFCYMPADNSNNPINFTHEYLKDALLAVRGVLFNYGIEKISCSHYGSCEISEVKEEQDKEKKLPALSIVSKGKVSQKIFLDDMKKSNFVIISGDWSYIESLLIDGMGLLMYCSRFHKRELHDFANAPIMSNSFIANEDSLCPVKPASQRENKAVEIIETLKKVVQLAVGCKMNQIDLPPNLAKGVAEYTEKIQFIKNEASRSAFGEIAEDSELDLFDKSLELTDDDEGFESSVSSAQKELMPGDGISLEDRESLKKLFVLDGK